MQKLRVHIQRKNPNCSKEKINSVWNKRIKLRVSTSKGTVQNNIMKCMVSKRSAWSKDAIIKITQFVDDLIQETEPGFKSSAF